MRAFDGFWVFPGNVLEAFSKELFYEIFLEAPLELLWNFFWDFTFLRTFWELFGRDFLRSFLKAPWRSFEKFPDAFSEPPGCILRQLFWGSLEAVWVLFVGLLELFMIFLGAILRICRSFLESFRGQFWELCRTFLESFWEQFWELCRSFSE